MDIERLKELKDYLRVANELSILNDDNLMQRIVENNDVTNTIDIAIELLNAEIARQSVKSEDVAEAIEWEVSLKDYHQNKWEKTEPEWQQEPGAQAQHNEMMKAIDLAITALQAYQPWVSVEDEKPESEKYVLLCCEVKPSGKRYVCDGFYAQSKTITTICDGDNNYEYDEETDEYYLIEGYYEIINNWDDYSSIVIDDFVTHWCPLPEPPKGE